MSCGDRHCYREITEIQRLTDNDQLMYVHGTAPRCGAGCYLLHASAVISSISSSLLRLWLPMSNLILVCMYDVIAFASPSRCNASCRPRQLTCVYHCKMPCQLYVCLSVRHILDVCQNDGFWNSDYPSVDQCYIML